MKRSDLRTIIGDAADQAGCTPDEHDRLVGAADGIHYILVGQYEGEVAGIKCGCPATVAGYSNEGGWTDDASQRVMRFPSRFDNKFGSVSASDRYNAGKPFVAFETETGVEYVEVTD